MLLACKQKPMPGLNGGTGAGPAMAENDDIDGFGDAGVLFFWFVHWCNLSVKFQLEVEESVFLFTVEKLMLPLPDTSSTLD